MNIFLKARLQKRSVWNPFVKITQKDAAKGISNILGRKFPQGHLSKIEHDLLKPGPDIVGLLCEYYGLNATDAINYYRFEYRAVTKVAA